MNIDYNILLTYGGVAKKYKKGQFIFQEDCIPGFFYQILEGEIRMFSTNSEGKEVIQGTFGKNQSFGEPPLLLGKLYPSSAVTNSPSVIVRLRKEGFLNLLNDYPEISKSVIYCFAERLYKKAMATQIRIQQTPTEKLIHFFEFLKESESRQKPLMIPFTRQQIADYVGLRIETVIRTLATMHKKGLVQIVHHKLYY